MAGEDDKDEGLENQTTGDPYGGATDEDIAFAESAGWKPKEAWDGPEDQWQDAAAFAADARKINKVLNKSNQSLRRELEQIKAGQAEYAEFIRAAAKREYDDKLAHLTVRKAEAISDGDGAEVTRIEREIDTLQPPPKAPGTPPDGVDPTAKAQILEWHERNPWYGQDDDKTDLVVAVSTRMRRERPDLVGNIPEWFAELDRRLVKTHPTVFGKKRPPMNRSESGNGSGNSRSNGGGKKSYDDLPADAKAACDRFFKQGYLGKDEKAARQEYVNNFDWSN